MSVSYGGDSITFADGSVQSGGWTGFRNRIINGAMVIDQRNAGASVTTGYAVDRWQTYQPTASKFTFQRNAGSVTTPAAFPYYWGATVTSAYSVTASDNFVVYQHIEGLNIADLAWGTASAATVTLSFWVRSSLTGTFGGALTNSGQTRSYPFTYTISSANTWTQASVTILGDTAGTWLTTNGTGIQLVFGLGVGTTLSGTAGAWASATYQSATGATSVVGTNGATFYITGVQLERGSTASSFEYRPYGTELALCQRYYEKSYPQGTVPGTVTDVGRILNAFGATSTGYIGGFITYRVIKRASATPGVYSPSGGAITTINAYNFGVATNVVTPTLDNPNDMGFGFYFNGTTANAWGVHYAVSAEL